MPLPTATLGVLMLAAGVEPATPAPQMETPPAVVSQTVFVAYPVVQGEHRPVVPAAVPAAQPVAGPAAEPAAAPAAPAIPSPSLPAPSAPVAAAPAVPPATEAEADDAIVVTARQSVPEDPAQAINLATFEVVDSVDRAVVGPAAMGYKRALPRPVRTGLRNFLANLVEPVVAVNYLIQFKPGKAVETLGRFAINSTVGVAGLIDVAKNKPFHLPRRVNGFANTMGYYGIGPGPYFFLPLIGPTTLRDLGGWVLDKAFVPTIAGAPFNDQVFVLSTGTIKSLDDRVEFDDELETFRDTGDAYTAEREYYLAKRKAEIEALHGRPAAATPAGTSPASPVPEATVPEATVPELAKPVAPATPVAPAPETPAPAEAPAAAGAPATAP